MAFDGLVAKGWCLQHAAACMQAPSPGLKAAPVFERQLGSAVLWQHAVPCHLPRQELHPLLLAPLHQLVAQTAAADPAIPSADAHLQPRPTKHQAMSSPLVLVADGVTCKGFMPCHTVGCAFQSDSVRPASQQPYTCTTAPLSCHLPNLLRPAGGNTLTSSLCYLKSGQSQTTSLAPTSLMCPNQQQASSQPHLPRMQVAAAINLAPLSRPHLIALPEPACGIVPDAVESVLQAQVPELVLPHAVVVHKRLVMPCSAKPHSATGDCHCFAGQVRWAAPSTAATAC